MTYLDFPKMLSNFWKRPINVNVDGERPSGGGRRSGESSILKELTPSHFERAVKPSFPRRACPVLDTGREPIPGKVHSHSLRGSPSRHPSKLGGGSGKIPLDNPPFTPIIELMYDNTEQSEPPTLADIVRRETNNGETIVRFYLDVIEGKLNDDGFEVCHRLEAAEQVHAIAPGLVSEYIAQLTGLECNHAILRKRTRDTTVKRTRDTVIPVATGTHPRPDADCAKTARARHEALEYLASALAAPSLAVDPRVAGIVHGSTDHGKTVVSFLMHVMHGVVRGFRPRQRVDAACELLGHIARDEIARSGSVPPLSLDGRGSG